MRFFYHLLHEGDPNTADDEKLLNIRSMLIDGSYSAPVFEDPMFGLGINKLTDRDSITDFPWIEGITIVGTNADGSDKWAWFILIPEILP